MTSRRSWLLGLALGAAITAGSMQDAMAQVPRSFTYQGQLLENNQPMNGTATIKLNFYTAGGTTAIHSETHRDILVVNGIFNLEVGEPGGFPPTLTFDQQYIIGVEVNGSPELVPRTRLLSVPYALNSVDHAATGETLPPRRQW
jgi:hypothetical protein